MNKLILLILISALTSCNFNTEIKNEESEKIKAQRISDEFQKNYNDRKFDANIFLFADETIENNTEEGLKETLVNQYEQLGEITWTEVHQWSTKRSKSDGSWYVSLIYVVDYENSKGIQQFDFVKQDDEIKILIYRFK